MKLLGWILCHILREHDWTCKAAEGIPPDPIKMKQNILGYFWEYATMYCKRCETESELNK